MGGILTFKGLLRDEAIIIVNDYLKKFSNKEKRWVQNNKLIILEILKDRLYSGIIMLICSKEEPLNLYQIDNILGANYGTTWKKIDKLRRCGLIKVIGGKGILNGRTKKYPIKHHDYSNILDMIFEILPIQYGLEFKKTLKSGSSK